MYKRRSFTEDAANCGAAEEVIAQPPCGASVPPCKRRRTVRKGHALSKGPDRRAARPNRCDLLSCTHTHTQKRVAAPQDSPCFSAPPAEVGHEERVAQQQQQRLLPTAGRASSMPPWGEQGQQQPQQQQQLLSVPSSAGNGPLKQAGNSGAYSPAPVLLPGPAAQQQWLGCGTAVPQQQQQQDGPGAAGSGHVLMPRGSPFASPPQQQQPPQQLQCDSEQPLLRTRSAPQLRLLIGQLSPLAALLAPPLPSFPLPSLPLPHQQAAGGYALVPYKPPLVGSFLFCDGMGGTMLYVPWICFVARSGSEQMQGTAQER